MNKTQLIDAVAQNTNLKKKDVEATVNATFNAIMNALGEGDKVQLIGFGNFEVKERAQRNGINPRTKEAITIAASSHPSFTPSKVFKEKVNK